MFILKYKLLFVFVYFNLLFLSACAYKILGLFPLSGKSHNEVFVPIILALANKGHDVTILNHYPLDLEKHNKPPQLSIINMEDNRPPLNRTIDMNQVSNRSRLAKYFNSEITKLAKTACERAFQSEALQNFVITHQHEHFDVILTEFFHTDCLMSLVDKFNNPPVIGMSSSTIMPWYNKRFANPTHPAYIPDNIMDYPKPLSLIQRVENTIVGIVHQIFYERFINDQDKALIRKYFGKETSRPLEDIIANSTSLLLVNSHFSLHSSRPLVPAIVEIAGVHLKPNKSLAANIEKWINESSDGVIYFSLGSMIKGHTFPEEKRQAFLRAFKRLPQRVLWKWENDAMPGKPDNVMIQKWMPQFDILSHPNVKAFISHGGLLGTIEAVHCGVPMLVMPQYGDQFTNARALEANGGGVLLQLKDADEEKIFSGLSTILSSDFRRKAQELSERFRDRPLPPLDTAIYWVEYVARHRGAHHMRTAAVGMPFYQYYLLDVIALLLGILAVVAAFVFYATRAVLRRLFGGNKKVKKN